MKWLVKPGIIDLPTLIQRMSVSPAQTFGLPGGSLQRGVVADVTVFDPTREWKVDSANFVSKGRNSPYTGHTLQGIVMCTIVGGRIVHQAAG
jgi:dihydroorotase